MRLSEVFRRVQNFTREAHALLGKHETSLSRVVQLSKTYAQLAGLSIQQDDLFRQSLRCVEQGLYRAAHVMAWAAFMDFLEAKIARRGLRKLHTEYPKWSHLKTIEDLRENVPEYQLIEASRKLGLSSKTQEKALQGLLNKRNECAHPSSFFPELNEALGYISELFQRISQIQQR